MGQPETNDQVSGESAIHLTPEKSAPCQHRGLAPFADIVVATPSLGALHRRRGVHEPSVNAARAAKGDLAMAIG